MSATTLALLLAYVDAAIDAALVRYSCGPHTSIIRKRCLDARADLEKHIAKDTEQ